MAYGVIDHMFWDDERVTSLGAEARLLAAFLVTGRQATQIPGLVNLGIGGLSEAAKLPMDSVRRAMAELASAGFAEIDEKRCLVRVPRAPKYNPPRNPNMLRGWFNRWCSLPDSPLKYSHLESLRESATKLLPAWSLTFGKVIASLETVTQTVTQTITPTVTLTDGGISVPDSVSFSSSSGSGSNSNDGASDFALAAGTGVGKPVRRAKASLLGKHQIVCARLWALQEDLRAEAIPGSRALVATDKRLAKVAERLEGGASEADCEHVLRVYAHDARSRPESAQWFNGETNWVEKNFERALGRSLVGGRNGAPLSVEDLLAMAGVKP